MRGLSIALAALALAVPALEGTARSEEAADDTARAVLKDERYRFCHEKDYPLTVGEHAWCPLVEEGSSTCPSLPEACKSPPVEGRALAELRAPGDPAARGQRELRDSGADPKRAADDPARRPHEDTRRRPDPPESSAAIQLPDLSGLAKVLLFAMVAAFVVVVARALARNFTEGSADEAKGAGEAPDDPRGAAPAERAPRGPVETDVERLLGRARAAAARGEIGRAIDDLHAALLRRLDGDGLIDIHPSRTNGDYVRALADRPDLRRAVRDVVRDVEQVQFGAAAPSPALFRSILDRVVPLVSRALGVAILCLSLGAAASCKQLEGQGEGGALGGTTPSGMAAVAGLLQKRGFDVHFRSASLSRLEGETTLVLVPGVQVDDAGWAHLLGWVREKGGRLVLAGVEPPAALDLKIVDGGAGGRVRVAPGREVQYGPFAPLAIPPGARLVPATEPESDVPDALLHRDASVYAVQRTEGSGSIIVLADGRLFTNAALAVPADALFLAQLFEKMPAPREVEICDAWTGAGAATPFESIQGARLTPVVVQLFVLLALLFLWRGRAFARLRDPPGEARRAFADHVRALGVAYSRSRASRHVLGLYAVWALERLRERVHRAGRQGLLPLAEGIAARTGRSEAEVMRVLVEASAARDDAAPPSSFRSRGAPAAAATPPRDEVAADLALMRELSGYLTATGARRPVRRSRNQPA